MADIDLIRNATQTLIDHVDELTALDQAIGDGDHGLNMRRGALAIQGKLEELAGQSLNEALRTMGMTCMSTIGGSSGPVFGTLMITLGKELPDPPNAGAMAAALDSGIKALTRLGKAEAGFANALSRAPIRPPRWTPSRAVRHFSASAHWVMSTRDRARWH